jgi:hypothetical protein
MFGVGKNNLGVKEYLTKEKFDLIMANPGAYRKDYSNQQWAKIRKQMSKARKEKAQG